MLYAHSGKAEGHIARPLWNELHPIQEILNGLEGVWILRAGTKLIQRIQLLRPTDLPQPLDDASYHSHYVSDKHFRISANLGCSARVIREPALEKAHCPSKRLLEEHTLRAPKRVNL